MKKVLIVFLVIYTTHFVYAQEQKDIPNPQGWIDVREDYINKRETISPNIELAKEDRVLMYENNLVIIKFRLSDIKESLKFYIDKYRVEEDVLLLKTMQSFNHMDLVYSDFSRIEPRHLDFQMGILLDKGLFFLIDKKSNENIRSIEIGHFGFVSADGWEGAGGKWYFLPSGVRFSEIIEYEI